MTRLVKGYNMRQGTGTKINFRESYDDLTLVFWPLNVIKNNEPSRSTYASRAPRRQCTSHETNNSCWLLQAPQLAASLKVTEPFHPQSMSRFYGRKIPVEIKKKRMGDLKSRRSSDEKLEKRFEIYPQKCVDSSYAIGHTPFLEI